MSFSIPQLDALAQAQETPREVVIVDPATMEPLGLSVFIVGPDSARVKAAMRRITDRRIANRRAIKMTAEDLEEDALKIMFAHATGWKWDPAVFDGTAPEKTPPEFSESEFIDLIRVYPAIRRQLDEEVGDVAGFLRKSLEGSVKP